MIWLGILFQLIGIASFVITPLTYTSSSASLLFPVCICFGVLSYSLGVIAVKYS